MIKDNHCTIKEFYPEDIASFTENCDEEKCKTCSFWGIIVTINKKKYVKVSGSQWVKTYLNPPEEIREGVKKLLNK